MKSRSFYKYLLKTLANLAALPFPGKKRRRAVRQKAAGWLEYPAAALQVRRMGDFRRGGRPSALLVNGELSVTGAPVMLLSEAKILLKNGFKVAAAAYRGGGLEAELDKLGIPCLISPAFELSRRLTRRLAAKFDLVVVNSIVCAAWIDHLPPSAPVMWYTHEGAMVADLLKTRPELARTLRRHPQVYAVTELARTFLPEPEKARVLRPGVADVPGLEPRWSPPGRPLRLVVVGSFLESKGQDLMLAALSGLDPDRRAGLEVYFIGLKKGAFYELLRRNCPPELTVFFIEQLDDQEAKWNYFNGFDVFCVPSRHESCSLAALEACMLGKPVIISDRVGAKYMLREGVNGLMFASGDAADLGRCLQWCLDHRDLLPAMGRESRRSYEELASWELFERNFMDAVREIRRNPWHI